MMDDKPTTVAAAITVAADRFSQVVSALANRDAVLGFVLIVGIVFWIGMLIRASATKADFDLIDALRGPDRRVQSFKLVMFACLFAGLWAFILYAIQGKMTEWMFFFVLLFGTGSPVANKLADVVVSRWAGVPPDPPAALSASSVKTTTTTEVKP